MNDDNLHEEVIITRARDFYLYDQKGTRYVDLYLSEGVAVLGHKPLKMNQAIKQSLDRGSWGIMLGRERTRAIKNCNKFLDGWNIRALIHTHESHLLIHRIAKDLGIAEFTNLLISSKKKIASNDAVLWNLYSDKSIKDIAQLSAKFLMLKIPIPWKPPIVAIYQREKVHTVEIEVSEVLLHGLNHIIPYLIEKGTLARTQLHIAKNRNDIFLIDPSEQVVAQLSNNNFYRRYHIAEMAIADTWKRAGIYVVLPEYSACEYTRIRRIFLDNGFYIPQFGSRYARILTLPPYLTKDELQKWKCVIDSI